MQKSWSLEFEYVLSSREILILKLTIFFRKLIVRSMLSAWPSQLQVKFWTDLLYHMLLPVYNIYFPTYHMLLPVNHWIFSVYHVLLPVSHNLFPVDHILLPVYHSVLPVDLVSNKRQNGWTDRAQIFCGTARDSREGLWIIKISNICLHQNSIVIKFFKILKIRKILFFVLKC